MHKACRVEPVFDICKIHIKLDKYLIGNHKLDNLETMHIILINHNAKLRCKVKLTLCLEQFFSQMWQLLWKRGSIESKPQCITGASPHVRGLKFAIKALDGKGFTLDLEMNRAK